MKKRMLFIVALSIALMGCGNRNEGSPSEKIEMEINTEDNSQLEDSNAADTQEKTDEDSNIADTQEKNDKDSNTTGTQEKTDEDSNTADTQEKTDEDSDEKRGTLETDSEQSVTDEVYTDAAQEDYYSIATSISRTDVESYAVQVRQQFLEHDWSAISNEISYPITIADVTYNNSTEFLNASDSIDGNFDATFYTALEEEDCMEMFCNWQGIMMGENGQVWIAEVLDEEYTSQGLKIIAINGSY